jgi:uncharacterized membrane protein YhaH (DUF805 family)
MSNDNQGQQPYGQQPPQYGQQPPQFSAPNNGQPYGQPEGQPYGGQQYGGTPYPGQPYGQSQYGGNIPAGPNGEPPLWAPWYGISFPNAVRRFFKKYAKFDGRASRSEFWWWYLANVIVAIVLYVLIIVGISTNVHVDPTTGQATGGFGPLAIVAYIVLILWALATIVPSLALGWRRLHDANMPGALWIIALFIPIVGIVFAVLSPNPEGARYDRPGAY